MSRVSDVIVKDLGWARIHRELKRLHGSYTEVGFQANQKHAAAARAESRSAKRARGKKASGTVPDMAMIAFWNEYGTRNKDGTVRIPRRAFMTTAVLVFGSDLDAFRKKLLEQMYDGKIDAKKALALLGERHEGQIKRTITTGDWKENAESTKRRKHSTKPLIDTGQMRAGVRHKETIK